MNASSKNNLSIDLLTLLAIGIVSFILKNVIHEFVVIERNWTWIFVAVILALFHIFILGPGVEF